MKIIPDMLCNQSALIIYSMIEQEFSRIILKWYALNGRKNLPWQHPRHPYQVWISEIMLQQTQVKTVIAYFERFINYFPDIHALAAAPLDEVMALWSGLGYYSRARNLHKTAQHIVHEYNGIFPTDMKVLVKLAGIGQTTAAAICSQAFNQPTPILDANVKRVLSRVFMINEPVAGKELWHKARQCMSATFCAEYTQGIMDFGAMCCTSKQPLCTQCPMNHLCQAYQSDQVAIYPVSKPKPQKSVRDANFYLIYHNNRIFLTQNPPEGIWGGLWSLPSAAERDHEVIKPLLTSSKELANLKFHSSLKHTFTHFHLGLHLWTIAVTKEHAHAHGRWFTLDETRFIGLPRPVQRILHSYQQDPAGFHRTAGLELAKI